MRVLVVLVVLFALVCGSLACENVLRERVQEVNGGATEFSTSSLVGCNSRVGSFNEQHADNYKAVINKALRLAFEYMSISSHFGRDTIHRLGFQKMFRDESDARFDQAIDLIKYVVKRGGNMYNSVNIDVTEQRHRLQPDPLPSLGLMLDDGKDMHAEQARLHRDALCPSQRPSCTIDPDLVHQTQDAAGDEVNRVNEFAKKANVLAAMYTTSEKGLSEHLFDMQLLE